MAPADPPRPQLAVSASIFRNDQMLLVRRARAPARGLYTLPGGRVEFGETLEQALLREIREETALEAAIVGPAGWRQALPDPAAGQAGHFVILSFAARWVGGEVRLNDELDDALWCAPSDFGGRQTTEGLAEIVRAAQQLISAA